MILQEMVCCNPDGTDSGSGEISPLYKNDTYDSYYVYALQRNNLNSGTTPASVTVTVDEEYYSRLPRIGDTLIVVVEGVSHYLIGYYKSQIVDQSITTPSSSTSSTTDTFPSINIGQFSESLNAKADRDLKNLSNEGREFVGIKAYDSSVSYSLGEFIITVISDEVKLYRSLANNNTSALTDTTKWEEVELGGNIDIDENTITLNSNNEIQTVGIKDDHSGSALKFWTGTRAQYDAILAKDANTLYNITNDTGNNLIFRKIGELVTSTIPLVDADLHLADGALLSGSGAYSDFVNYMAGLYGSGSNAPDCFMKDTYNVDFVGTITKNNGVMSGFSTGNYASVSIPNIGSSAWNYKIKFTTGSDVTTNQIITSGYHLIYVAIQNGQFQTLAVGTGSSWIFFHNNIGTIAANTVYELVVSFTGSAYNISLNGTSIDTYSSTTTLGSGSLNLGILADGESNPFSGSIDLSNSSWTVAGNTVWNGFLSAESAWQSSVFTYGICGKYVYDSVNNTVRLPKIEGFIEGTTDATALGDLIQAGLPNITGEFTAGRSSTAYSGASLTFNTSSTGTGAIETVNKSSAYCPSAAASTGTYCTGFKMNASRSSSIYGNSSTVQPQSTKVFYYVVIATSTKTSIQVDIDEIATDLNGKADIDAGNFNAAGKSYLSGLGMPYNSTQLTLLSSGSIYKAPSNGWFAVSAAPNTGAWMILQSNVAGIKAADRNHGTGAVESGLTIPVLKDQTASYRYDGTFYNNQNYIYFIKASGEN